MIQAIVVALITIWLAWGIFNVVLGIAQILWGIACGIAAVVLYIAAAALELIFSIFPGRKAEHQSPSKSKRVRSR